MTNDEARAVSFAAKLKAHQRQALIEARQADGEIFARSYSVPDALTKAWRVAGVGDALNPLGLAVRAILLAEESARVQ